MENIYEMKRSSKKSNYLANSKIKSENKEINKKKY